MKLKFVFILLASLTSCAAAPKSLPPRLWEWSYADVPMTVVLHDDLKPETVAEIVVAIAWWNDEAEMDLFAPIGEISGGAIVVILPMGPESPKDYEGLAHKAGSTVGLYIREESKVLPRVIRHELGHALGLPHIDDRRSVMFAQALSGDYVLTEDDMENLPR